MTKKQFRHDFLRGLGSALLELKQNKNPQQYYEIVRYGCLHNTTYDMQSEGERGWYLHQAAMIVGSDTILNDILSRYSKENSDDWLFNQLTSIIYHFAVNGNDIAYSALYDKYKFLLDKLSRIVISKHRPICNDRDLFNWVCLWLTSLDGWGAFTMIVNDMSEKLLSRETDFFFNEWFYVNSQNKFGKKRVKRYLQKQSEKSVHVYAFWQKAQEWDNHIRPKQSELTLDKVIAKADDPGIRGISLRFAKNASSDDLCKLYLAAMQEDEDKKRVGLLWGLRRATSHMPEEIIFDLMDNDNQDIREIAFCLMENNPSPAIRKIAVTLLQEGKDTINALSLLSKNILPEDEQLFCDTIKAIPAKLSDDKDRLHDAFIAARTGSEKLRGKPKTDLLFYVYKYTNCAYCREWIVRLMHKKKILTNAILQECLYDSNCDIRVFVERVMHRNAT